MFCFILSLKGLGVLVLQVFWVLKLLYKLIFQMFDMIEGGHTSCFQANGSLIINVISVTAFSEISDPKYERMFHAL